MTLQVSFFGIPLLFYRTEHEVAYDCAMQRLDWLEEHPEAMDTLKKGLHEVEVLEALQRRIIHRAPAQQVHDRISKLFLEVV
jgi:hypothetical protein